MVSKLVKKHNPDTCHICTEVAALAEHGWSGRTIVDALRMSYEDVDKHMAYGAPHLRHYINPHVAKRPIEGGENR